MLTSPRPLVSIIMPCYNGERYITSAIKSIQTQSFNCWELLVVDNNSSDNSSHIVQSLKFEDNRIKLLACRTPGAAAARNFGINLAQGRYITFLDCDDQWLPHKLEAQIKLLKNEGAALSWGAYEVVDTAGEHLRNQPAHKQISYTDLLYKRKVIGCLTAIYDREAFGNVLMPLIRMRQDYGLFLKLLRTAEARGLKTIGLEECIAKYREHNASMTHNKTLAAYYQWRLYRDIEKLTIIKSVTAMSHYVIGAIRDRYSKTLRSTPTNSRL